VTPEPIVWCDCGHRLSAHTPPVRPDGERGRCMHCRCQGFTASTKYYSDDRREDGDDAA
jgi:hypothetical protein